MSTRLHQAALRSAECNHLAMEFGEYLATHYRPHRNKSGKVDGYWIPGQDQVYSLDHIFNQFKKMKYANFES